MMQIHWRMAVCALLLPFVALVAGDCTDAGAGKLWKRVRHTIGNRWHSATDNLAGSDVYGTATDDTTQWSIQFDDTVFDLFMFASGSCNKWLVAKKEAVYKQDAGTPETGCNVGSYRDFVSSSVTPGGGSLLWYNRIDCNTPQDPWVSLQDHSTSVRCEVRGIVYGESNMASFEDSRFPCHSSHIDEDGGFDVYIRVDKPAAANPLIPFYGYGSITVDPNPAIAGEDTGIAVKVQNSGDVDATNVALTLSYNDWGISFFGWQEIGTDVMDVPAGGEVVFAFSNIFENQAHTCLEAKVVGVDAGGNTITTDDRAQINLEVVHCDNDGAFPVPIMNGGDEEMVIEEVSIKCRRVFNEEDAKLRRENGCNSDPACMWDSASALDPDSDGDGLCDGLDNDCDGVADLEECPKEVRLGHRIPGWEGELTKVPVPANQMVLAMVEADLSSIKGTLDVVVQATWKGEKNHVLVQLVHTSVEAMLNHPMLCCITKIRVRVMLETILARALEAYEAEDPSLAVELLRLFLQRAESLECELSLAEKGCLQRAVKKIIDVIRMIARANALAGNDAHLAEGDFLRRAGLYKGAAFEYARAFDTQMVSMSLRKAVARSRRTSV